MKGTGRLKVKSGKVNWQLKPQILQLRKSTNVIYGIIWVADFVI